MGLRSTRDAEGDLFGEDRGHRTVADHRGPAAGLTDALTTAAISFQDGEPRDDIVVVAFGPS